MCDTEPLKYHLLLNQIRTRKAGGDRSQACPSVNAKDFQCSEREKKKKTQKLPYANVEAGKKQTRAHKDRRAATRFNYVRAPDTVTWVKR